MTTVAFEFVPATKQGTKARVAIEGPSGAGKTWTSLLLAAKLGDKIGVLDTEHGSASKYASEFSFRTMNLTPPFTPERYIQAIRAAERAGLEVLVIDSLSHEWDGEGGILQMVDAAANVSHNKWQAWAEYTPRHKSLIEIILRSSLHVIVTMRSKMDTDLQTNATTGRKEVVKLGMKAVQREGFEYEYDVVAELDLRHEIKVTKTRCRTLDGYRELTPDMGEFAHRIKTWLADAAPTPAANPQPITKADLPEIAAALGGKESPERPGMVWSPSHQAYVPVPEEPQADSPRTENRTGYADTALAVAAAQQKITDGKPLTEGQVKVLEEGFNVARDKNKAKKDVLSLIKIAGYVTWEQFVAHGAELYPAILEELATHDRAKGATV